MRLVSKLSRRLHAALVLAGAMALSAPLGAQAPAPATTPANPAPSCSPANASDPCGTSATAPASQPDQANAPMLGIGNPINLANGNKHQTEVDMPALPGVLGLELVRHYDSARSQPASVNRLLGRGWRLSYETELHIIGSTVQVMQADGSRVIFSRDASNPAHCASTDPARGHLEARRTSRGEQFVWHWPSGRRLHFDERGRLDQIVAATGEFVSLRYDLQGLLIEVRDPQGRTLRLDYASRGASYGGVTRIETPVGRYDYAYGGDLPSGADPALRAHTPARLIRVSGPAAQGKRAVRHYLHDDPRHPTLLTGIAAGYDGAEAQRLVTWAYDDRGRAILSLRGPASDPSSERIVLRHVEPAGLNGSVGRTEAITARGVTTYEHAIVGGEHRLIRATEPGCASCAETDRAYSYDRQGRLIAVSRLDAEGRTIDTVRSERDALGRVVRVERVETPSGKQAELLARRTPARLLARYEYPADREPAGRRVPVFEPSLIAKPSVIEGKEHRWRLERNEAGQITRATETGYSPLDANGQPNEAALERSTTHTYRRINGRSLLAGIDGPLPNGPKADPSDSDVTQFEWDEDGNAITRVVQPGVLTNDLRYDAAGRVAEVRNDAGHVSRFVHDALGHITRLTQGWIDPSASGALLKARFQVRTYDAQGRLVEAGHAATNEPKDYRGDWRLAYDAAGRVHQMASARGTLWTQTFDADGRVQEASQRSAHFERIWRYRHDEQGRLTQTEDGALDVEGQPPAPSARYVHDEGRSAAFDALDRPVRLPARIEARPGERLTTAANGATTRERLDDFGRVVVLDSADSGRSLRWFDEADRLVRMRDAVDHQARYAYDVQGRIAEQAVGNPASTTRWRYEGRRLVEVQGRAQTERYEYDAFGRRTRKTVTLNVGATPVAATTAYGYDDQDRLRSQSLADGSLVVYERDGQGQVTALRRETVTTAWLRWLAPSQTLACDIRRDAGGLTHHQAGNGIRTEWQRSKAGVLAQLVHRRDEPLTQHQARTAFIDLLGMGSAHAQAQRHATGRVQTAFTQPRDPRALIDHRYLWDRVGNLLMDKSGEHATAYAYDAANRLIAAQRVANALRPVAAQASTPASLWRYHHDANGNRLLAQEGDQAQRIDLAKASNRSAETDAAGQTTKLDGKRLEWDAIGRLASVKGQDFEASYAYSHRGERIGKTVRRGKASTETGYLHDDAGRIAAELNASGRITRLVVHMADLPLAVIDGEAEVARPHEDAWQRIAQDLKRGWKARAQATVFLHLNHLSAPEAATDQAGRVVWTASYAPYGRATTKSATFKLHLRLPGQYEDEETGLHDNRHRTYDPDQGRYLSADPLGLQGGPNGFVYVAANPLRYVDPEGLVLFAFDGTGNDESDPRTYSNVVNFRELYSPANGQRFYITGPGTLDPNTGIGPNSLDPDGLIDMGRSYTGPRRIAAMEENLALAANAATDDEAVDIDIVGFSRGAAQAREFANRIVANTRNGCYSYVDRRTGQTRHQRVNFRFMGLWDTVLSTHTGSYQLRIPDAFEHVAHAVALNEHRSLFPGESIMGVQASTDRTRVERGFLGAHSDIGGSFPDGDLARVALVWMVDQATAAGVVMRSVDRTIVANPVLHDSSSRLTASDTGSGQDEDRSFTLMNGARTRQVQAQTLGMSWADTQQFISYLGNPNTRDDIAGTVDMRAYLDWLNEHGYGINMNVTEAGQ